MEKQMKKQYSTVHKMKKQYSTQNEKTVHVHKMKKTVQYSKQNEPVPSFNFNFKLKIGKFLISW